MEFIQIIISDCKERLRRDFYELKICPAIDFKPDDKEAVLR